MSLTELLIAALAVWHIIEIWHHSEFAASMRAKTEVWRDDWAYMFRCPFCMSPWVAWVVCMMLLCVRQWMGPEMGWPVMVPIYALAVARLANLGNDVTHHWCRTPRTNKEIPEQSLPEPPGNEVSKSGFEETRIKS